MDALKDQASLTERALRHSPMETASIAVGIPLGVFPQWEPYKNWFLGVRLIDGQRSFSPVMRRVNECGKAEYRHMTPDEASDYLASTSC